MIRSGQDGESNARSSPRWSAMRYVLPSVMLMVAGCGGEAGVTGANPHQATANPHEAMVESLLRKGVIDKTAFRVIKWGPHYSGEQVAPLFQDTEFGIAPKETPDQKSTRLKYAAFGSAGIRVKYFDGLMDKDDVFIIRNNRLISFGVPAADFAASLSKLH